MAATPTRTQVRGGTDRCARLEQGATYIDLRDPHRRELTATGDMVATREHWYVPKDSVDYQLWNRLIGIHNPERLYTAPGMEE